MTTPNDEVTRKAQLNYRFGEGHLLNLYAGSVPELNYLVTEVSEGEFIANATAVGALLNGAATVQAVPTPPQAQGGQQYVPVQPTPQPVVAGGGQGQAAAPSCPHGVRTYRDGVGAKGRWQAYFCPTPKGTPGQCEPQWIK